VDAIVALLEWHGGVLLASKVLTELKAWKPKQFEACKMEVQEAGGMQKFILLHNTYFTWAPSDTLGAEMVHLCNKSKESDKFAELVVQLVRWHGGSLLASRIFNEMKAWRPSIYEQFRFQVNQVGGMKRFVDLHAAELVWISDGGGGRNAIQLVNRTPSSHEMLSEYEWSVNLLEELIDLRGGELLASKVMQAMHAWKPDQLDDFKTDVFDAGGLKKLIHKNADRFEWVLDEEQGRDAVRILWPKHERTETHGRASAAPTGTSRFQ
jgi:hypothetical protein